MLKKSILLLSAATVLAGTSQAQGQKVCGSDEVYREAKAQHPEIAELEAQLELQIKQKINRVNLGQYAKTTGPNGNFIYDIPVVFHIVHDYGTEYVSDNDVYAAIQDINTNYSKLNGDTSTVIAPYKGFIPGTSERYIGKANIRFHLATKDPAGQPAHGITRHRSYLAYNAGDQAKYDLWAPDSYINIWIIRTFDNSHAQAAAYAYKPVTAAITYPYSYYDGVISLSSYMNTDKTLTHELGHVLNLDHPWGGTNQPDVACGDDAVDDTPPTKGHNTTGCTNASLYDTVCSNGYTKTYTYNEMKNLYDTVYTMSGSSYVVNYPDTVNSQNIMDYTYCSRMFTNGQVVRMRNTLENTVARRNHLWNDTNLFATGVRTAAAAGSPLAPWPDLAPVADFSLSRIGGTLSDRQSVDKVYGCADGNVTFTVTDRSWMDTVSSRSWTFSNGATTGTSTGATVSNKFTQPGWVTIALTANSNAGSNTTTRTPIYVADPNATDPNGYYQEFNDGSKDAWPSFNYYNNNTKWEMVSNAGYYDQYSVRYKNYDNRTGAATLIGTPRGDYDDLFSPAFNLSGSQYSTNCNLNFYSAGAFRTTNPSEMIDSLEVWYSIDCGNNWSRITALSKGNLANAGTLTYDFVPGWQGDWKLQSIAIPAQAKTSKTMFRFRFKPGTFQNSSLSNYLMGSGNNFYMDRINISSFPTGIDNTVLEQQGIVLAPNPTTGGSMLTISGGKGAAQVQVTDVTGKVVYRTQQQLNGTVTSIEIPAAPVSVKGMYLVQVVTDSKTYTQKLVVY